MAEKRIHYCKSLKKTGKPIIVLDTSTGKEKNVKSIKGFGYWEVKYNNARGKEKRRGATTTLRVWT